MKSRWNPQIQTMMSLGVVDNTEIPLLNVAAVTLKKVIKYMEHYKDTPQPTSEEIKEKRADTIPMWDEEFLVMPIGELYDLVSWRMQQIDDDFLTLFHIRSVHQTISIFPAFSGLPPAQSPAWWMEKQLKKSAKLSTLNAIIHRNS
jgi:hypothetical protein